MAFDRYRLFDRVFHKGPQVVVLIGVCALAYVVLQDDHAVQADLEVAPKDLLNAEELAEKTGGVVSQYPNLTIDPESEANDLIRYCKEIDGEVKSVQPSALRPSWMEVICRVNGVDFGLYGDVNSQRALDIEKEACKETGGQTVTIAVGSDDKGLSQACSIQAQPR